MIAEFHPSSPTSLSAAKLTTETTFPNCSCVCRYSTDRERKKRTPAGSSGWRPAAQVAKKLESLYRVAFTVPTRGRYHWVVDTCPRLGFGEMAVGSGVFQPFPASERGNFFCKLFIALFNLKEFSCFFRTRTIIGRQSERQHRRTKNRKRGVRIFPHLFSSAGWILKEEKKLNGNWMNLMRRGRRGKQPHSRFLFWYQRARSRGAVQVI